jgi:hypothetical protein
MRRGLFGLLVCSGAWLSSWARADDSAVNSCAGSYVRGQILRNDHKLVEARDVLRDCAQPVCKDFIVKDCSVWLDMVQASLPAVVPVAMDEGGNTLYDIKVAMDGKALVSNLDGRSVEVDPGLHTFEFETPDGRRVDKTVLVPEGDKQVRVAITLSRPEEAVAAPALAEKAPFPQPATAPPPPAPAATGEMQGVGTQGGPPWKSVGLAVAGAGVLGVAVGAFFGLDAISKKNAANCNAQAVCPSSGQKAELDASIRSGNVSTASFAAGGILAAAGVAFWAFAPRPSLRVAMRLEPGAFDISASGSW